MPLKLEDEAPTREEDRSQNEMLALVDRKSHLGRNIGAMVTASFVSALTGVILLFWIPRVLSVDDFGYWRAFILYTGYAGFLHFGLVDGALLRWSQRPQQRTEASLTKSAFALVLVHTVLSSLALAIVFTPLGQHLHARLIAIAFMLYALAFNVLSLGQVYLQAHSKFHLVAIGMSGSGALFLVLLIGLRFWRIDLVGIIAAYLVAYGLTALFLWIFALRTNREEKKPLDVDSPEDNDQGAARSTLEYVRAGWPIMLANAGFGLMQSADRMTVNVTRPIHDFAIYSLSQSTIFVPITIIAAVSRVAFSHFVRVQEVDRLGTYRQTVQLLTLLWSLLLPFYFGVEWVVIRFLPRYAAGLPAGKILLLSVLFLSLISIVQANTFNLMGRQKQFFLGSIGAIVLAFGTAWIGSRIIGTLSAVAWSQVLSAAVWWLANEWALLKAHKEPASNIFQVLVAFIVASGCFYIAGLWGKQLVHATSFYLLLCLPMYALYRFDLQSSPKLTS